MAEKRRHNRINLRMVGKFLYNDTSVDCLLENLSMNGALISTKLSLTDLNDGDICTLEIPQEAEHLTLAIQAKVVHRLHAYVGLCFCGLSLQTYSLLEFVIQNEREKQAQMNIADDDIRPPTPGLVC